MGDWRGGTTGCDEDGEAEEEEGGGRSGLDLVGGSGTGGEGTGSGGQGDEASICVGFTLSLRTHLLLELTLRWADGMVVLRSCWIEKRRG